MNDIRDGIQSWPLVGNFKTVKLSGTLEDIKRREIIEYFHNTFSLYEELFSFIKDEGYYVRAEPLRHPLIFYFGHTATFIINKLITSGFKIQRINPYYESIFAVGVDEMSWDDLNTEHYNWPTVEELREYRHKVRAFFDDFLKKIEFTLPITWESPLWIALMICEHERIHLETSSVIMRRLSLEYFKNKEKNWKICEIFTRDLSGVQANEFIKIPGKAITLGKKDDYYGWDNEYGSLTLDVKEFSVNKFLTTNKEYLDFVKEGGYKSPQYWTEEGKRWLSFQTLNHPIFWNEDYTKLRLFNAEIDMPWDWPVEVNYLEAKAYCNWKAEKTGVYTRLPTESEWYVLRGDNELDGNIDLKYFASSCPVNMFKHNFEVYDIIGNVWQWSETAIDAFPGFKTHPSYKDFSVPTFDGKHNLIKGGSWISTGNESIIASRYAFRRHFYQHAGFRCVIGEKIKEEKILIEREPEVIKWINAEYDKQMYERFKIQSFSETVPEELKKFLDLFLNENNKNDKKRILVLGCKTGALSFEMLNYFDEVIGMDQTAYHFRVAVDLKEGNIIRCNQKVEGDIYNIKEVKFDYSQNSQSALSLASKNIEFFQTDLYNDIDTLKHKAFDAILVAHIDQLAELDGKSLCKSLKENGLIFVMVPKGLKLTDSQFPSSTFKKVNMIESTLNPIDHKLLFRETNRKHQLELYQLHCFKYEIRQNAHLYYENDFVCEQYIRFHYGIEDTFPNTCGKLCLEYLHKLRIPESEYLNALDLGCALGQTSISLTKFFKKIHAIDYSYRFIEIAKERVKALGIENINFLQGNALDLAAITNLPKDNLLVFCGNLIDRLEEPKKFLVEIADYVKKGGLLILTSPYTWLEQFTPKENWIGGVIKNGEIINTLTGLDFILKDNFEQLAVEEVQFSIPDYPPFSHQLTVAELSVWVRK